ncbi:MAG TPA: putative sugar nucleotidyl transferase, partial [Isosphaeraceae bacterium]|nr:putative sugar nucleotidyl transferase [Isosphaeraceae bacterium]
MRLCLVEDQAVSDLEPLTLTRPAFDLLLGPDTLGSKLARAFRIGPGPTRRGALIRPHLAALWRLCEPGTAINDRNWLARAPVVVANARWVPPADFLPPDSALPWVGTCDGLPACAAVGPDLAVGLEWGGIDAWFDEVAFRAEVVDL